MSKTAAALAAGIRKLANRPYEVVSGYVTAVDEEAGSCTVKTYADELELDGVLLRGTDAAGDEGVIIFPAVDSDVVLASVDGSGEWVLIKTSIVEKVVVKIGSTTAVVTGDDIVFNDGTLDGLVKVGAVVSKLNAVENDVNTLKQVFTAWVPVPSDGGAALKAAVTAWAAQMLTVTQKSSIENPKIKQ